MRPYIERRTLLATEYTCQGCSRVDEHEDGKAEGKGNISHISDIESAGAGSGARQAEGVARGLGYILRMATCQCIADLVTRL